MLTNQDHRTLKPRIANIGHRNQKLPCQIAIVTHRFAPFGFCLILSKPPSRPQGPRPKSFSLYCELSFRTLWPI
jgi:hypothetical protein